MGVSVVGVIAAGRWTKLAMPAYYIGNVRAATGAVAQWHARNQSNE